MTNKEKLTEATILALQGKLTEAEAEANNEIDKAFKWLKQFYMYNMLKESGLTDEDIKYILSKIRSPWMLKNTLIYKFLGNEFNGITLDNILQIIRVCDLKTRDYDHLYDILKNNEDILQKFIDNKLSDDELKKMIHYSSFYIKNKKDIPYLKPYKVNTAKSSGTRSGSDIANTFENTKAAPLIFEAIHNLEQSLNPYKININDLQLVYIDKTRMLMGIYLQDDKIKDIITDSGNSRNLIKNTVACSAIYNEDTQKYDIAFRYAVDEMGVDIVDEGLTPSKELINAIVTYFNSIDEELINDYKRRYKKN